ncbi:MAG: polyprenyl synthetase family protein [Lachnospiraceae bacterium]|jgi:geranylgeranyl diphosphate synthase type II|nr:polyprenyl synthetase family protein [Lachnospiraceae bacterium]
MNFEEERKERLERIEKLLCEYLPEEEGLQKRIMEAINYSVLAGGKRLRPMLMLESYQLFGGKEKVIEPFMAAIEMIHTYSLIHDDLPAMDNDLYRRGRKTTHAVYGEAMAILAGDGLLNLAYETAAKAFLFKPGDETVERAFSILLSKAGIYGMVGGQTVDVLAEKERLRLTKEQLLYIHANKTAALIQAPLMIGAVLAGADTKAVETMEKIGYNVGIAFQIRDDILDVTGTLEELGKPIGSDKEQGKETYITLFGMEAARKDEEKLSQEAISKLGEIGAKETFLAELIGSLINRRK